MRTMLTMPNIVHLIISNITPTVYIRYTAFWNFSKLVFVLHILAFTKFQLRWCAQFQLLWTLFKSSFLPLRSLWKSDLKGFQTFETALFFRYILAFTKFQLRWCAPFQLLWTLFKSSFFPLRSLWKSDLKCFQTFRNCGFVSAHFGLYEISTPVMRTMLTMANIV